MKWTEDELKVYRSYHTPGCSQHTRRPVNAVFFNPANSLFHELAKAKYAYELQKRGFKFVCEAVRNDDGRRVDLVCLFPFREFEFETSKRRAERFVGVEGVLVVPLWGLSSVDELVFTL